MPMIYRISTLALLAIVCISCQLTPTFTTGYQVEEGVLRPTPVEGSLAVSAFAEERPPRFYNTTGRLFLTYVPLIPYVTLRWERLDESIERQSRGVEGSGRGITLGAKQNVAPEFDTYYYPKSFSAAVADDLRSAGLFEDVEFVGDGSAEGHRYHLTGVLRETPLRNSTTSFGLGMFGVLFWFLPVPISKTTAEVALDLELFDLERGTLVWKDTLMSELHRYYTLYNSSAMVYGRAGAFSFNLIPPPGDAGVDRRSLFSWHFGALRRGMLESRKEIAAALVSASAAEAP